MVVYKLNEIAKTLDKIFKYNAKTTEKVANLKWKKLGLYWRFFNFREKLYYGLENYYWKQLQNNRRRKIEKEIIEFLAGNPGEQIAFIHEADTDFWWITNYM